MQALIKQDSSWLASPYIIFLLLPTENKNERRNFYLSMSEEFQIPNWNLNHLIARKIILKSMSVSDIERCF